MKWQHVDYSSNPKISLFQSDIPDVLSQIRVEMVQLLAGARVNTNNRTKTVDNLIFRVVWHSGKFNSRHFLLGRWSCAREFNFWFPIFQLIVVDETAIVTKDN